MSKALLYGAMGCVVAGSLVYVFRHVPDDDVFIRLASFAVAGLYAGLLFVVFILPLISDALVSLIYGSAAPMRAEDDDMRQVRVLQAQGDFVAALEELRHRVTANPGDREAWSTMAKIQMHNLKDSEGGVATMREALHGYDWDDDSDAFFRVSIAAILAEEANDRDGAVEEFRRVVRLFPNSHYAAQATDRLQELEALQ
ncbi:tetratricopeptide repeat protein [Rubritalea marina]|uniref:tetratricopeptide repeat protein n=1 Tax=Rubritalea marina TaxID=361055 RepID=UPI0003771A8D|nr:hypothetical protein [Rubritalea marina]